MAEFNDTITFKRAVTFEVAPTTGDGTGSPTMALDKSAAGTADIILKAASTQRARIRLDASENLVIGVYASDGTTLQGSITIAQSDGSVTLTDGLTISTGNLAVSTGNVSAGDGTGSPAITANKDDTGTADVALQSEGVLRGRIRLDASENVVLGVYDSNGDPLGTLSMLAAGGGNIFSKGVTISTGGLEVSAGNVKFPLTDYADNAAALAGGLTAGMLYRTGGAVAVVT